MGDVCLYIIARALMLQTAKHWGVAITPEMIGREKAKGNANNDWVSRMRVHSLIGWQRVFG